MEKIAILVTTFLRDDLLLDCIKSILDVYQKNWFVLVADQGNKTTQKDEYFKNINENVKYYNLPFDCGLSSARNFLVQKTNDLDIQYCLITADSIHFTKNMIYMNKSIDMMTKLSSCGILGLNVLNRVKWEYLLELIENKYFLLKQPTNIQKIDSYNVIKCDIIKNFFIAKTEALITTKWDDNLKLGEHEDYFWRFKNSKWNVYWTDICDGIYINNKPQNYIVYRDRMYREFRNKLKEKYKIKGWIKHEN